MRDRRRFFFSGVALALAAGLGASTATAASLTFEELYTGNRLLGLAFSDKTESLADQTVAMQGFMAPPLKAEADFFVLTRWPVDLCPFCDSDADWPADILVVYPAGDQPFTGNTVPIEVTGTLEVGGFRDESTGFYSRLRLVDARFRTVPQGVARAGN